MNLNDLRNYRVLSDSEHGIMTSEDQVGEVEELHEIIKDDIEDKNMSLTEKVSRINLHIMDRVQKLSDAIEEDESGTAEEVSQDMEEIDESVEVAESLEGNIEETEEVLEENTEPTTEALRLCIESFEITLARAKIPTDLIRKGTERMESSVDYITGSNKQRLKIHLEKVKGLLASTMANIKRLFAKLVQTVKVLIAKIGNYFDGSIKALELAKSNLDKASPDIDKDVRANDFIAIANIILTKAVITTIGASSDLAAAKEDLKKIINLGQQAATVSSTKKLVDLLTNTASVNGTTGTNGNTVATIDECNDMLSDLADSAGKMEELDSGSKIINVIKSKCKTEIGNEGTIKELSGGTLVDSTKLKKGDKIGVLGAASGDKLTLLRITTTNKDKEVEFDVINCNINIEKKDVFTKANGGSGGDKIGQDFTAVITQATDFIQEAKAIANGRIEKMKKSYEHLNKISKAISDVKVEAAKTGDKLEDEHKVNLKAIYKLANTLCKFTINLPRLYVQSALKLGSLVKYYTKTD